MTFNPEDPATSPNQARIKTAYEKARARGNDDLAEEICEADSTREQLRLTGRIREYDPRYDDTNNATRVYIRRVYEALEAAGHDDRAEELAGLDSVREQRDRARTLAAEVDLEVRA